MGKFVSYICGSFPVSIMYCLKNVTLMYKNNTIVPTKMRLKEGTKIKFQIDISQIGLQIFYRIYAVRYPYLVFSSNSMLFPINFRD